MVYECLSWFAMVFCGLPWVTMVYRGFLWFTVGYYGLAWFTAVYSGLLWFTKVCYGILWFTVGFYGFAMVYCGLLWFTDAYVVDTSIYPYSDACVDIPIIIIIIIRPHGTMIQRTDILLPRMGMKMWAVEQVPVFASRLLEIMDGSYWHPGVFKQDQVSISKKTKKQKTTGCLGFHIQSSKFSGHPSPKSIASSKTPRLQSQDRVDYKTILWIYNFAEGCSEVETPSEQPKSKPQLGVFRLRYGENGMELAQFDVIEEFQRGNLWRFTKILW